MWLLKLASCWTFTAGDRIIITTRMLPRQMLRKETLYVPESPWWPVSQSFRRLHRATTRADEMSSHQCGQQVHEHPKGHAVEWPITACVCFQTFFCCLCGLAYMDADMAGRSGHPAWPCTDHDVCAVGESHRGYT